MAHVLLQEEPALQETARALLGKREYQLESSRAEAPSKWAHGTMKTFCMKWDTERRHKQWWFDAFAVDPAKLVHDLSSGWEAGTPQPYLSCKLKPRVLAPLSVSWCTLVPMPSMAPTFGSPTTAQGVVVRTRIPRCGKASSIGSLLAVSQMRALTARLQVRMRLSVAYHPRIDVATETTHSTRLGRLRTTAYTYHSDWEVLRPRYEPLNISYEYA
jgi:hypothetical protein